MKESRMFRFENMPPWDGIPRLCAWLAALLKQAGGT